MVTPAFLPRRRGFTLIELLVSLAIIALLMSIVAPRYLGSVARAEEAVLRQNLALLRDAIDKHHADTGKYPDSLDDLVRKRYVRSVPLDPVVQSANAWVVVAPEDPKTGAVYDVRSSAHGTGRDGKPYEQW
jgi:general secretion pathway protein G